MGIKVFAGLLLASGAVAAQPLSLLCIDQGKLVVEREDGSGRDSVEPSPGARLIAIGLAGRTLAAVTEGNELLLTQGKRWRHLGKLTKKGGTGLMRATSDARGAHFFLQGGEDNQVAGALDVSAAGKVTFRKHPDDARRVAPAELGAIDAPEKWEALRGRLKAQIPQGISPEEALVFAEPSPWGGALVAVATGEVEGETAVGELWFVPDSGAPVALRYKGELLDYRGLLGYIGDALVISGDSSAAKHGTLLIRKTGKVTAVPKVDGLCIAAPH